VESRSSLGLVRATALRQVADIRVASPLAKTAEPRRHNVVCRPQARWTKKATITAVAAWDPRLMLRAQSGRRARSSNRRASRPGPRYVLARAGPRSRLSSGPQRSAECRGAQNGLSRNCPDNEALPALQRHVPRRPVGIEPGESRQSHGRCAASCRALNLRAKSKLQGGIANFHTGLESFSL
jgi:hypothetical protein